MPSPILKSTIQAAILSAISNLLAQAITAFQANKPFSLNTTSLVQFSTFALLNTPWNYLWQQWLEETFPGSKPAPRPESSFAADVQHEKTPGNAKAKDEQKIQQQQQKQQQQYKQQKQTLDVKNTAKKFLMDQTFGATANTVAFIAGLGAIKGMSGSEIVEALRQDTLPIMLAGARLWPLVSLISFSLVPVEKRVVFGGAVGVVWGIYLSLIAAK